MSKIVKHNRVSVSWNIKRAQSIKEIVSYSKYIVNKYENLTEDYLESEKKRNDDLKKVLWLINQQINYEKIVSLFNTDEYGYDLINTIISTYKKKPIPNYHKNIVEYIYYKG